MKRILLLLFLATLLVPTGDVFARDAKCFTKKQCEDARLQLNPDLPQQTVSAGWIQDAKIKATCGGDEFGFCLPIGKTVTNIKFGGRSKFENIAEFIAFSYRYATIIATILAVVMIIIAGIQWTISGGSSEIITKARQKIGKALLGLFLLLISYSILYLLNPNLVQFRLPQVWLINQQAVISPFCASDKKQKLAYVDLTGSPRIEQKIKEVEKKNLFPLTYKDDAATRLIKDATRAVLCGHEYLVKGSSLTCRGDLCPLGQTCFWKPNEPTPKCEKGSLIGKIFNSHPFFQNNGTLAETALYFAETTPLAGTDPWEWKWANEPEVYVICNNGTYHRMHAIANDPDRDYIESGLTQQYVLTLSEASIDQAISTCKRHNDHKGFVLSLDMNSHFATFDERHFLGVSRENRLAVDLADKRFFSEDKLIKYLSNIDADLLLTEEELRKGYGMNVDVWNIYDIEEDDQRVKAYGSFGYK